MILNRVRIIESRVLTDQSHILAPYHGLSRRATTLLKPDTHALVLQMPINRRLQLPDRTQSLSKIPTDQMEIYVPTKKIKQM